MKTRYGVLLVLAVFMSLYVRAQENILYNQYHFNYYLANPALAGANNCSYFMLTHKQQWVGLQDAPFTSTFSFQTRTKRNVGIGGYLYTDKNGYSQQQGAQLTVAYHIPLTTGSRYTKKVSFDRQLSFAVSAKFFNYGFSADLYKEVVAAQDQDPAMQDLSDFMALNANFGVYYTDYGFFTGLSFTNLAKMKMPAYDSEMEPIIPLNGLLLLGNEFEMGSDETLEPSFMLKFNTLGHIALDLNAKYMRRVPRDKFSYWLQLTYRQNMDKGNYQSLNLMPMLGMQFNKFHLAYAYDLDLNRLIRYNYGSHELMLGYTLCYTERFCR